MANIFKFTVNVILLLAVIYECNAGRCTRTDHSKRSMKKSGDGGYRVFIDGDPKGYQPGKIYNGKNTTFHLF